MTRLLTFFLAPTLFLASCMAQSENITTSEIPQDTDSEMASHTYPEDPSQLTEAQWRERLTDDEYRVLRGKGTERAGSGQLNEHEDEGIYRCAACGAELFRSTTKFHSGCGWPAFFDPADSDAVVLIEDHSLGMLRTEVRCANCDSHLGHVFYGEGYDVPNDSRYCINSVCLDFEPVEKEAEQETSNEAAPVQESAVEGTSESSYGRAAK